MNYEIVSVLRANTQNWNNQKKRALKNDSRLITLLPDPFFLQKQSKEYQDMINVIDFVTGRTYDPKRTLFFNKAPVADGSQIFMNPDGTISIIKNGERIAKMRTFPGTRRLVQDITYYNTDGTRDVIEEYTMDGQLFSNIFYYQDQVQEMDFFDNQENVRVRFYFYEGKMNLITVEDPHAHAIVEKYDNMAEFQAAQVAKIVTADDQVGISYLGIELDALVKTDSKNTLYLDEGAFDGEHLKGNLQMIIENQSSKIQRVVVGELDYQKMKNLEIDMQKIETI